jgi:hypothetical protein
MEEFPPRPLPCLLRSLLHRLERCRGARLQVAQRIESKAGKWVEERRAVRTIHREERLLTLK